MNGVHDLGGMHGFGPIERESNEPRFHAAWEARVRALMMLSVGRNYFNLDAFRYGMERLEPAHYLRAPYFERWLASGEANLIEGGFLSLDELNTRTELLRQHPETTFSPGPAEPRQRVMEERPEPAQAPPRPRFVVGDLVVTRNVHPTGHTRLPRYARGKAGVIGRVYGPQIFPDTNAHGLGEQPQTLYNVRFDGRELWGESAEPDQVLTLDLWDSYLEPTQH